jgi:hypothetical protein
MFITCSFINGCVLTQKACALKIALDLNMKCFLKPQSEPTTEAAQKAESESAIALEPNEVLL